MYAVSLNDPSIEESSLFLPVLADYLFSSFLTSCLFFYISFFSSIHHFFVLCENCVSDCVLQWQWWSRSFFAGHLSTCSACSTSMASTHPTLTRSMNGHITSQVSVCVGALGFRAVLDICFLFPTRFVLFLSMVCISGFMHNLHSERREGNRIFVNWVTSIHPLKKIHLYWIFT